MYDESCKSIFMFPEPLEPHSKDSSDQPEPALTVKFVKDWEQDKARENTKNWNLDGEGDKISQTRFIELFSLHCLEPEDENIASGAELACNTQVNYMGFILS